MGSSRGEGSRLGSRSEVKVWGGVKVWGQGCGQGRWSRSGVKTVGSMSGS